MARRAEETPGERIPIRVTGVEGQAECHRHAVLHGERVIVAVNYAPNQSQCHARLPFGDLAGKQWRIEDQLDIAGYDWNGDDLQSRGLFLDMTPWKASVFKLTQRTS